MIYFQSLTQEDLTQLILPLSRVKTSRHSVVPPEELESKKLKQARYRSRQIFQWVYCRFVTDWDLMTDLSKDLRSWLKENIEIFQLKEKLGRQALDGTHKFLWELHDGKTVESVIIPAALQEKKSLDGTDVESDLENEGNDDEEEGYSGRPADQSVSSGEWRRLTACISSQVGCAMACKFCLTGIQGLDRHLQVHEIVTQVWELRRRAPITNIVFMGMGEPLHNLENVIQACRILLDQDGLNFSKRKVTVSTSGIVPAIRKLGESGVGVSLAISLNGSNDEQRTHVMPVNKKWNIKELLDACREYPLGSHRRITFEYVLMEGINNSIEDAARVAALMRGIPSKVNLIPFNEHSGSEFKRPSDQSVREFQTYLMNRKITATVRVSRGRDILAACGQLRSIFGTARGTEKHKDWNSASALPSVG